MYKNIALNFSLLKTALFLILCFSTYKMADSEYSTNVYKSLNIDIGTVVRNPEMLKFVLEHLKTKKLCEHAVKNYFF